MKAFFAAFFLLTLLTACGAHDDKADKSLPDATGSDLLNIKPSQNLTIANKGKSVAVVSGDTIAVSLDSCQTCGAQWKIVGENPFGEPARFFKFTSTPKTDGGPAVAIFIWNIASSVKLGSYEIKLEYSGHDPAVPPSETFNFTAVVENGN